MADSLIVRDARPGDGPGMAGVWLDAARTFVAIDPEFFVVPTAPGLDDWFERLIALPRDARLLIVAELGGEVVGHLGARLVDPAAHAEHQVLADLARRTVHVDVLATAARHRRQGVGRALMEHAFAWAREHGAHAVAVDTELENPSSMAFYEKTMGMRRQSVTFRTVL
jgi:GNAT superfamily N-acetyltransferase